MATLDLQEQEQLDALKAWWKDNRSQLFWILLIVVIGTGGWQGWKHYQRQQANGAANLYQQLVDQLASNDARRVNDAAAAVVSKFGSSAYAARAELLAARVNEEVNDPARAKVQLQWVIDNAREETLKDVARLRLATLQLDEKNYTEALALLDAKHPDSFDGLYSDLKGDVLSAQGKIDEARSSYRIAYQKIDPQSIYRNLIQMKLDALGPAK